MQQVAFNLQVAVATQGRVQVTSMPPSSNESAASRNTPETVIDPPKQGGSDGTHNPCVGGRPAARPLIEVIDERLASGSVTEASNKADGRMGPSPRSAFHEAVEMMKDPLIPVQGHALISLRRLVEKGDKDALDASDMLFKLCLDNITHSDSYIYLNAVQLMAALVIKFPKNFLPLLVKEYLCEVSGDRSISADCRMKLGEVLVKTSAALGECLDMLPMLSLLINLPFNSHFIELFSLKFSSLSSTCLKNACKKVLLIAFICLASFLSLTPLNRSQRIALHVNTFYLILNLLTVLTFYSV